jgi:transcriptional regulator with XRE-family HTH domain
MAYQQYAEYVSNEVVWCIVTSVTGGQFVLEARRRAGMSQRQLAGRVGLSQPEIARIESGVVAPSFERVVELVRACGFDLAVRLVPLDEDAYSLAEQNMNRSPDERLAGLLAGLELYEQGVGRGGPDG